MSKPKIVLSSTQILMAAQVGVMRRVQFLKRNAVAVYGAETNWQMQIEGALSEYALSKYLGIYWEGVGIIDGDDVGDQDVRVTEYDHGSLILHPRDADDKKFWLLTGKNGTYTIQGHILGKDGKQDKYWKEKVAGRPAFFVPQSDLVV